MRPQQSEPDRSTMSSGADAPSRNGEEPDTPPSACVQWIEVDYRCATFVIASFRDRDLADGRGERRGGSQIR